MSKSELNEDENGHLVGCPVEPIVILPCPFCGTVPEFDSVDEMYGTHFDWQCEGCSCASISIQLDHHFLEDELGITEDGWENMQFSRTTREAVRNLVIDMWNERV